MRKCYSIIFGMLFSFSLTAQTDIIDNNKNDSIIRIEMYLSALGVESDYFPSIDAVIDFKTDTSLCKRSYYNPQYKESRYTLSKEEKQKLLALLNIEKLELLDTDYTTIKTDQPRSITTIYTTKRKFIFNDYGLEGHSPLKDLYKIVYQFENDFFLKYDI